MSASDAVLADNQIRYRCQTEQMIEPYNERNLQAASYDLTLGPDFRVLDEQTRPFIMMDGQMTYLQHTATDEAPFHLGSHRFVLATTVEYVKIPVDLCAKVEGRSSIGRIGLFVQNAGWIDPGFHGQITLELYNANSVPIIIIPGVRICQLVVQGLGTVPEKPYQGKYQKQLGTTPSRLYLDPELKRD